MISIVNRLTEIEEIHDVSIIYAGESGSRAYGSETSYSDHDVKFIYYRSLKNYLRLTPKSDVIEELSHNSLELHGWDLKKALDLFRKSNPTLYEMLHSPIVYRENNDIIEELRGLVIEWFSLKRMSFHYLNMASTNTKKILENKLHDTVLIKTLFQAARAYLAVSFIVKEKQLPPIKMADLIRLQPIDKQTFFQEILDAKRNNKFLASASIESLLIYIQTELEELRHIVKDLPDQKVDEEPLNQILWKLLGV
ncbi:nucleotidyltransferase domain-containing protein [Bacillus luteolus]|uniref:Nucleotidyltransferase domain-containing protein n=1 Tax=Litchfieldia luteola TaxID=682179 RepID=A0ABR9QP60_9BACI|nr:nucleotidyltransferase domain-containing protein [Cytobacillus luteolus]MBE4910201.1 nucleotidyltransferase domain-containing protein [Cytobacillus luteolus]MBP1942229.1 putative nucleotidyltransferase [Cytobacillus luteolus]